MDNKYSNPEDQINVSGIKAFFVSALKDFFRFIDFLVRVIDRKKYFLLIGMLGGLILGAVYYINKPKQYKASMVVVFNRLTKRTYGEVIDQLSALATTGAYGELARTINLPDSTCRNIMYIEGRNIYDELLEHDTSTRILQPIKIVVGLYNNIRPYDIQNALISYINNLPYLKKLSMADSISNALRLKSADNDLAKLDTLKTEYNRFLSSSKVSATIYNNAINPAEIYIQSSLLLTQRESAQRVILSESGAISLVDGFKLTNVPYSKSLSLLLFITGLIGLLGGFSLGMLLEVRQFVLQK